VDQLNLYTRSVHHDAESKRRLDSNFVDPLIMTAGEFAALVKADAVKWERIVRETGAKLE
jgi:tripartite-type tricarboxylate transporter receptor subunit TctC